MKSFTRHAVALALGVVLGTTLTVTTQGWAERGSTAAATSERLPLDELRLFTEVLERVKQDYVEPIDDKTLLENAVRGVLSGLDPHSTYLDQQAFDDLQAGTSGEFGGLGIEVDMEDGFVRVVSPIEDTPAYKAGVRAGDLIIRLDDTPVKGLSLNDAVKLMRGAPGTPIVLTIVREGEEKPLKITVQRDIIQVKSVKSDLLESGFGYVRITQFQARTSRNLQEALDELQQQNNGPLKGMILDLRNNPGGVLNGAVEVADLFLDKGMVVYTQGRGEDSKQIFQSTPGDTLKGAPLVVLVNGGSASASEIVAGALQDQRRALIVGERTFGKGSVQTILPLQNGTAIKLTTARYYTPSGRSIQAQGIEPDIKLESLKLTKTDPNDGTGEWREANLAKHLENDTTPDAATPDNKAATPDKADTGDKKPEKSDKAENKTAALAQSDYPLYEALNLLKGMSLMQLNLGK